MFSISVCMIIKNEEAVLERCLNCVKSFADEIIIVDTGSCDNSKTIAKKHTNKVFDFKWVNDFSKARNFAFSKGTKDYLMWLDADDIISEDNQQKLIQLKNSCSDADVFMLKYVVSTDENNNSTFEFYRERLLKRTENFSWQDPIHEVITPHGKIEYKNISIHHQKNQLHNDENRNLNIYEKLKKDGIPFSARMNFFYGRELFYHKKYKQCIKVLQSFLNCKLSWKENCIDACNLIAKCYIAINNPQKALEILFYSFNYDTPRSENLVEIGGIYMQLKNYNAATYYLELATKNKIKSDTGAFVQPDYYNFLPFVNLSVCYYYLNNLKKAKYYHNKAKELKPKNPLIINNNRFFK